MKHYAIFLLILCLVGSSAGEKRRKPKTIKQLTDPSSIFYVAHPYPQNRQEMIKNLEIQARRDHQKTIFKMIMRMRYLPNRNLILDFFDGKTSLKIGEIIRVKNRNSNFAHDYSFLIPFLDEKSKRIEYVAFMKADGFSWGVKMTVIENSQRNGIQNLLLSGNDILKLLSRKIGREIKERDIKEMERLQVNKYLGNAYVPLPMWEIVLKNGEYYYYSLSKELFYTVDERIPWKKDKNGKRKDPNLISPYTRSIADSVNDEIM